MYYYSRNGNQHLIDLEMTRTMLGKGNVNCFCHGGKLERRPVPSGSWVVQIKRWAGTYRKEHSVHSPGQNLTPGSLMLSFPEPRVQGSS